MVILLNNRQEEFVKDTISVNELLDLKKFSFRMKIIKINGRLITRDVYDSTFIKDGDNVQMIYLISGG